MGSRTDWTGWRVDVPVKHKPEPVEETELEKEIEASTVPKFVREEAKPTKKKKKKA